LQIGKRSSGMYSRHLDAPRGRRAARHISGGKGTRRADARPPIAGALRTFVKGWVIAHSADLVATGERAFVLQLGDPAPDRLTYSSLLSAHECGSIDLGAYHDARSWYVNDGRDTTVVEGVSLGRAFEYGATETLVRHYRAEVVLRKLLADSPDRTVRLRGVGDEWWTMARAIGAEPISEGPGVIPSPATGAHPLPPSRSRRLAAQLASLRPPKHPWLVLVGSPVWAGPYHRRLLRHTSAQLVNPSRRVLLYAIGQRAKITSMWLTDLDQHRRPPTPTNLAVTSAGQEPLRAVAARFQLLQASMASWAESGRCVGESGVVAVATQDVLPPERAFLLGLRAAGGRVITLEHGLSGSYMEQVSSVADVLAAWGEPQAAYHRAAGPPGLRVVALGWPRLESSAALAPPAGNDAWDLLHFSAPSADLSAADWPEAYINALQMVEGYARQYPHRRVAIKLHPSSPALGFGLPPIRYARLVTAESLALIRSARVVLVVGSTTGIEAMSLGRPVLQVLPRSYTGRTEFEFIGASGAARPVVSVDELAAAMERLLSDGSDYGDAVDRGRAYARSFIRGFGQPGGAVRRLAELVAELRHS
jgi:hypothetical protein